MSKSNTFENQFLLLIFNNTAITLIGDAAGILGSAAAGNLYLSLHTGDPGEAGDQTTNEIAYTGYARVALPRSSGNFSVTNNVMSLNVNADFPEMTAGAGGTVTYFGIGASSSGAGKLLWSGPTDPDILISAGVTPRLKGVPTGTPTTITED